MGRQHKLSEEEKVVNAIPSQAAGTGADAVVGSGVDVVGYQTLFVVVNTGAIVDAANTSVAVQLQHSSDNGVSDAFTDITGATTGAILNAGENDVYLIDVNLSQGYKRYIRAVVDGGSVGGGQLSVNFELARARVQDSDLNTNVVSVGYPS